MLCTYCGADTPSALDRCIVCHAPLPPDVPEAATSPGSGPDDEIRLQSAATPAFTPATPSSTPGLSGVPPLPAGQTFANRYTIIRLLGAGGMAAVYEAWDESLGAAVALKLRRVDPAMHPADVRQLEDRFKRELELARRVTHSNVVRIHDVGEVGSTLYLTMAYVQGIDLGTLLQRDGRMSIARALSLARQIAAGLAAAHTAGVVHQDLKPANIMVEGDDHALITDFGIARSTTGMTVHPVPGTIDGTRAYVAPEQTRGEPADQRTDIFAFGLILYELLSGERPRGTTEGGASDPIARLEQGPPPLRTVSADVPADIERIVSKCLKSDPGSRYATANELLTDLEALDSEGRLRLTARRRLPAWKPAVAAAVAGAVLVTGTWWVTSNREPPPPAMPSQPVPVLIVDFENRAQEPIFEGALEQALSIAMEGAPFITAYPRKDAAALVRDLKFGEKLNESTGRLVANREGIRVILAGSIERDGVGYQVAVRAVDPGKPEPLAVANAKAADKSAVLSAVGRVADSLRKGLGDTTPSTQHEAQTFTAASLDAIREYTIAQDLASNQKDAEAVVHYREALRHDPEFGRAYAGLATSLHYLGQRPIAAKYWTEALKRMDRMTEREKLRTSGTYHVGVARDYAKAIEEYEQLVRKYPADSSGHNNLAVAHFSALNFGKALQEEKKAIQIYPRSFKFRANYALYAMYASDFPTAATTARELIKEDPKFEPAYLPLAMEALAAGDAARARGAYQQAASAGDAGTSLAAIGLADIAMYEGRYDEAVATLPSAIRRDKDQKNAFGATAKLLALAEGHAVRGPAAAVRTALTDARALGDDDSVLVTTGRLSVASGRMEEAKKIASELAQRLPAQSRAYAMLIEAEIAVAAKQYPTAIESLLAAVRLADLWLVRYALGLAYFLRGDYVAANSEFEKCQARRGEAMAIFLDDLPTFRYYAPLPYWLGRSREMLGRDARPHYEEFLKIRGSALQDLLVDDARRRVEALRRRP